jgi:hypothetical protein
MLYTYASNHYKDKGKKKNSPDSKKSYVSNNLVGEIKVHCAIIIWQYILTYTIHISNEIFLEILIHASFL